MAEHSNERNSTSRQIPIKEDVKRIPVGTKTNEQRKTAKESSLTV